MPDTGIQSHTGFCKDKYRSNFIMCKFIKMFDLLYHPDLVGFPLDTMIHRHLKRYYAVVLCRSRYSQASISLPFPVCTGNRVDEEAANSRSVLHT